MKRVWRSSWGIFLPVLATGLAVWAWPRVWSQQQPTGQQVEALAGVLLESVDSPAGFCVHLGVSDGALSTALSQDGKRLVHGLATNDASVETARQRIAAAKLTGVVSVQKGSWNRLPYADNLANLVVVEDLPALAKQGLRLDEVQRVVKPGGVVWLSGNEKESLTTHLRESGIQEFEIVESNGIWAKVKRPQDASTDQWTHTKYDASGNPVSKDSEVGVPTGVRWVAGPNWPTGYRKSAVPNVVATDKHLVYLFQDEVETAEGPKKQDTLIARDAHNGLLLWKRKGTKTSSALAAVGDRIYTVIEDGGPLVALDAQTGTVLTTFEGTRIPPKVLHIEGRLLVESEGLTCFDSDSGKVQWTYPAKPEEFIAADGKVYLHTEERDKTGKRVSQFVCLDLDQGERQWQEPTGKWSSGAPTLLLVYRDVLVAAGKESNHAVSAQDGKPLWSYEYPTIGHGGSYSKVLAMQDLVWIHTAKSEGTGRYAWEGLDPMTGKVQKRIVQPEGFSMKHRCSYDVATNKLIMCGSMDFADYETGEYHHFEAARNSCQQAAVRPANGILYSFPHACGCYPMLRGFLGLESRSERPAKWDAGEWRLIRGPAFEEPAPALSVSEQDWPTYRHDALRTGSTTADAPEQLEVLWSARVGSPIDERLAAEWDLKDGGRLSSPVVAGSVAIAASTDEHRIVAVNSQSGKSLWTFTAGGRIDCPPTLHEGLCLFGSRDGWVYCVRADNGELIWQFCAAPRDERIIAYGQLESKWPVVGGVLIHDGLAYFGVGRHADSDGGITVCAVEPGTGKLAWAERAKDYEGIPDILAAADGSIQMASYRFDAKTGENRDVREALLRGGRLGILNDAWYRRPIAMRKNLQQWQAPGQEGGQILAYHAEATCSFQACKSVAGGDGEMSGDAELSVRNAKGDEAWSLKMPNKSRLRGMAVTPDRVYVAGLLPARKANELKYLVQAYSLDKGRVLDENEIPGQPVHDGLAVANGRVYVSLQDGRLLCLGEK